MTDNEELGEALDALNAEINEVEDRGSRSASTSPS